MNSKFNATRFAALLFTAAGICLLSPVRWIGDADARPTRIASNFTFDRLNSTHMLLKYRDNVIEVVPRREWHAALHPKSEIITAPAERSAPPPRPPPLPPLPPLPEKSSIDSEDYYDYDRHRAILLSSTSLSSTSPAALSPPPAAAKQSFPSVTRVPRFTLCYFNPVTCFAGKRKRKLH